MSQQNLSSGSLQLPITVRLTPTGEPIVLTEVEMRDDGSAITRVRRADGSSSKHRLTAEEFCQVTVVETELGGGDQSFHEFLAEMDDALATDRSRSDGTATPSVRTVSPASASPLRRKRWLVVLTVVMALVIGALGGFGAGYLVGDKKNENDTVAPSATTATVEPIAESFDGNPGSLDGRAVASTDDLTWKVISGSFQVDGGVVTAKASSGDHALAVLSGISRIDSFAMGFNTTAADSGLVFRYQDDQNYWSLVASPKYGTWMVDRVVDGKASRIANSGFSGGNNIEVVLAGVAIQLWVEGTLKTTIRDATLSDATGIGITIGKQGTKASVAELLVNSQ
jgi:hypothetical protein